MMSSRPVALRCRHIARQRKALERGKRNVVRAANAGLQHAAAPHRNAALHRRIVHRDGLGEAAHAARLDVDDAAGFHVDRRQRIAPVADRFVQADRRLQPLLQHGVVVEVVGPQRLLDHQQVESVEVHQVIEIAHAVGRVRVHAQHDLRPALAHRLQHLHVPARLALQLDALIARIHLALHLAQLLLHRGLNADRHAARDALLGTAQQLVERRLFDLRLQVPNGVLQRSLRHRIAAHLLEDLRAVAAVLYRTRRQHRSQFLQQNYPRRIDRLRREVRMLAGHALAPAHQSLGVDLRQQHAAIRGLAEAGHKRLHQRHADLAQNDCVDSHRLFSCSLARVCPVMCHSDAAGDAAALVSTAPAANPVKPSDSIRTTHCPLGPAKIPSPPARAQRPRQTAPGWFFAAPSPALRPPRIPSTASPGAAARCASQSRRAAHAFRQPPRSRARESSHHSACSRSVGRPP